MGGLPFRPKYATSVIPPTASIVFMVSMVYLDHVVKVTGDRTNTASLDRAPTGPTRRRAPTPNRSAPDVGDGKIGTGVVGGASWERTEPSRVVTQSQQMQ